MELTRSQLGRLSVVDLLALGIVLAIGVALVVWFFPRDPYTSDPEELRSAMAICSAQRPCIDIDRKVDFTKLSCGEAGKRNDVVELKDIVRINPPTDRYEAMAEKRDGYCVELFDAARDNGKPLAPAQGTAGCYNGADIDRTIWTLSPLDGQVRLRWVWTNAHSSNTEGISFAPSPLYRVRSVAWKYDLPSGVKFDPPESVRTKAGVDPRKCVLDKMDVPSGRGSCTGLGPNEKVVVEWKWNAWTRCSPPAGK